MRLLLCSLVLIMACGGSDPVGDDDVPPPDAGAPDAALGCGGPAPTRQALIDASVDRLRQAFGVDSGFEGGDVYYSEMWVSLGDGPCPLADWSALFYVVPVEASLLPPEVRANADHVAMVWALNGRAFPVWLNHDPQIDLPTHWQAAYLPDSMAAVARDGTTSQDGMDLAAQLSSGHPGLTTTWLDSVRILTVDGQLGDFVDLDATQRDTVPELLAAVDQVRASDLFSSIEWGGPVFRIPYEDYPERKIDEAVLQPECLRTETKDQRDQGFFTTRPSLAAPLGQGPIDNPDVCPGE